MKKILYQLKNHIKYLFKRKVNSFELFHCERLMEGGYANKKTYNMVLKKYKKHFPSLEEYHIPERMNLAIDDNFYISDDEFNVVIDKFTSKNNDIKTIDNQELYFSTSKYRKDSEE
jgi:hypothetical protein